MPTWRCRTAPASRSSSSCGPGGRFGGGWAWTSPRWLVRLAAERGDAVVFLGGEGDVAVRAAERWRAELPGLAVEAAGSGVRIGEDGVAVAPQEGRALIERIRAVEPRVVLVAFGAPKQER